ncbi:hypothetical protein HHK36_029232 [Tetracentron sinense]|uniref:Retrovirus-related Pol polyprotein from transposon TNT 1-94-like beta-barrel domain-containing protein n=1 Tax=Tetracentron sinense TaxID=13715 RepID=A0A835D489_TETSI|nr:hypothetical protein HHK36_029232 [Tetracentron sinense]
MASSSNTMSHEINPGMKITTEPLNGSNYLYWSNAAKLFISSRSKLWHINGKNKAPNESSTEYDDWLSNNHLVMTWLLNSMKKNIARTFRFHTTAEGIWNMAKELYGEQNNIARTYQIKQELMSLKKGNKPFNEFVGELSSLFDELEFYVPLTVDAKELQKQKEQDKIFTLLAALPSDYEMFRSQILMASELPTFSSVCATIAREETRRKVMSCDLQENFEQSEKSALKTDSSSENIEKSFVANNNTASKGRGKGRKGRPYCTYCKKDGHVIDKCWKIHGKLDREKAKDIHVAQSVENETPLTMEKLAQFFNQFGKVNIAFTSPSCDSGNPSSFLSSSLSNTWLIDSGATDHMSKSINELTCLHTNSKNSPVSIANGSLIPVKGNEKTNFFESAPSSNVLFVPEFSSNLLSDRATGKKIGEGQQVRGLYVLDRTNKALFSSNKVSLDRTTLSSRLLYFSFINCTQFGFMAVSLGYYETLMSCSGSSTSSEMNAEALSGILPGLVRMSIGYSGTLEQKWS